MEKNAAIKLIRDTFQNPFDKDRFIFLTKNLLKIDESKAFSKLSGAYIKDMFREYINSYERLGTYTDSEGKHIDVLIVYLQKESTIERARTSQRNFAARYLKDRDEKDAGLIAFVSSNPEDWRFSLVKMEYKFTETDSGKVKVKEEFTPAKRFSFLVGENESSHTAQSRLMRFLENDDFNPILKDLEEAFNIEKVTKEFFEKYRALFLEVKETLDNIVKKDKAIREDFSEKGVDTIDFSKKLIGQIVFLYFLQKKGWFGVERDAKWGTGPKKFLRLLFGGKVIAYKNFFNDILEPLFYEALAIERDKDFYRYFNCKIPFLNGGLFDPINNYDWVHTDILLPDELFSNKFKTKEGDEGTGILDIFDRYNFTVKEDEPLEKEVAVDPEMLGKVFENLLEVKDRKSKGTYYTPREIVHYMCQESLINYLSTELERKANKEEIEKLIRHGESVVEHDSRVEGKGKETKDYSYLLPENVRKYAELIDGKLATIRACDPAVGSGAFLVGMMNEVVRARNTLTSYFPDKNKRTVYDFKRHAIQNCLYGVDIDPGAVEIAKLRLWLSLIVDEEDIKQIKPLPNLDYKIMQGNSLLEEYEGIKLFDENLIAISPDDNQTQIEGIQAKQSKLQKEFLQLHSEGKLSGIKKQQIETELNSLNNALKNITKRPKTEDKPELFDYLSEAKKKSDELKQLHKEIFDVSQKSKKDELRKKIENLEWDLIEETLKEQNKESSLKKLELFKKSNTRPFFLWKLHFTEIFQEKGGFDVSIANPPYIRQEEIKALKPLLQKANYEVYNSTSDLYTYFYERSINILKSKGTLTYISSNKWLRADYGEKLRKYFKNNVEIIRLIDFGGLKVFDATVDTNVLIMCKEKHLENYGVSFVNIKSNYNKEDDLANYCTKYIQIIESKYLNDKGWSFAGENILRLKQKMEKIGVPLRNWNIKIFRGIITGFNSAFIIDNETKIKLCKEDDNSKGLLEPILKGRDIKKYYYRWQGLWLIKIESGETGKFCNGKKSEKYFKAEYPAIFKYFKDVGNKYKKGTIKAKGKGLFNRDDQGKYWWELRDCDYYNEFKREKIAYKDIADKLTFCLDRKKMFLSNTAYFMVAEEDNKYLLGVLNSKLLDYYYRHISSQLGEKGIRHFSIYIEQLPIPKISNTQKYPFINIVDKILNITDKEDYLNNPTKQAKAKEYESQIDQMVYKLYGLSPEEIKIVEGYC